MMHHFLLLLEIITRYILLKEQKGPFSSVFFSFSVMKADPCDPYPQLREFGKLFLHLSGGESTHIAAQVPH